MNGTIFLCLFNISLFSSQSCTQAMSKRKQEGNGEERIAAKSKPVRSLVSTSRAGSSTVPISTASSSLVSFRSESHELNLIASMGEPLALCQKSESKASDKMWNSHKWQTDAWSKASTEKHVAWDSVSVVDLETPREYNFLSSESVSFVERVSRRLRIMLNRPPGDPTDVIDKHSLIWCICLPPWTQSSFLGEITQTIGTPSETRMGKGPVVGWLGKLVGNGDWKSRGCRERVGGLLREGGCPWWAAGVYRSLGGKSLCILRHCVVSWESASVSSIERGVGDRLRWFENSERCREVDWIDGEPVKFERVIYPGFTLWQILLRIGKLVAELDCAPEQFQGKIIFMSIYNGIVLGDPNNEKVCVANSALVAAYAQKLSSGHWSFLGPGSETKWKATNSCKPGGEWDRVTEIMMIHFSESGHPMFRATSAERGALKSKGGGKYPYMSAGTITLLMSLCSVLLSLSINTVSTEQWQICARNSLFH